jgi:serine/threonine-protein kinase SMG1
LIVYPAVVGSTDGPTKIESMQSKNEKKLFDKNNKSSESSQHSPQQSEFEYPDEEYQSGGTAGVAGDENQNEDNNNDEDDVDEDGEDDDEGNVDEQKKVELQNSYKHLLDTLSETNLKMINEVKLFLNEMRRITLLREELWLGTLNQIHSDINKRMEQLTNEINKVNNNSSLNEEEKNSIIKEKYEILLAPIVSVLEYVYEITKLPAETPNEENFLNDFTLQIKNALDQLKDINNAYKPWNGWSLFKQLHHLLYQRSQRKNLNTLFLEQLSPKLNSIKSSTIPIPGEDGQYCTIYSIAPTIQILPTKTKPKKLFFIGSNGKKYPYLFKGLEDLHLDERIMQLLAIVNTMFSKVNKSEFPQYHALNYSVTPLGPRSGLISWVDGSTPLFSLYKKWQQREFVHLTNKQQQQQQQQTGASNVSLQILRPNELYYNKLNSIVKEKGLKSSNNRNDYPLNILKQVLEELIKETPNDLLSKELWCGAPTPGCWWNSVQKYSRSTAVMSIIGYIIGLGDRHLDNVLVNLQTGDVAHIDYNICFEKGKNLRIPEKVPFRLTQNLVTALGVTGVEGVFRLSCEHVLKILRKGRETLLTLLEAFVYDPLLDWTGNDTGIIASFYGGSNINANNIKQTKEFKRDLDKKITYRLYSIRLLENKALASKNSERFLQLLVNLDMKINSLIELVEKQNFKEKIITLYEEAKEYLEKSLKEPKHYLYTLHDRYNDCMEFNTNMDKIQVIEQELHSQYEKWMQNHEKSIDYIKSNEINELIYRFKTESIKYTFEDGAYHIASEFLQSIGQLQQFQSCEIYEKDLQNAVKDVFNVHLKQLMLLLDSYVKLFNWLPQTIYKTSRHCNWLNWLKELKNEHFSKEKCKEIIHNFNNFNNHELNLFPVFINYIENENLIIEKFIIIKTEHQIVKSKFENLIIRNQQLPFDYETLGKQFNEIKNELTSLINKSSMENRASLISSLKCETLKLIFQNLCKWNVMENASLQAKQQLVTLTSKDGDWFLDEMISLITNCNSIVNIFAEYLNSDENESYLNYVNIIENLTNVFLNFKNLLYQYQQNIFSNLLKYSTINDQDFRYCFNELEALKIEEFFYLIDRNNFEENFSLVIKIN